MVCSMSAIGVFAGLEKPVPRTVSTTPPPKPVNVTDDDVTESGATKWTYDCKARQAIARDGKRGGGACARVRVQNAVWCFAV